MLSFDIVPVAQPARKLNYLSQLTVDTAHHVITDIKAYYTDGKDNQQLQDIVVRVQHRLHREGLAWENCAADTGYGSGENYAFLEDRNLKSFTPPHGTYKGCPDGFAHNETEDHYVCSQGKIIPFKKVFYETKNQTKRRNTAPRRKSVSTARYAARV
ncbi:hypothetical protein [Flavivirga sp. 57AJ16]|uniref:hypothetical protein n=1 Tax=Flavivirga sp. 57AJ16 TaxID=3025307 RepID=UPI002366F2E8|nr:hypothetical protein [Flavivirga sp. 57AJ16]MDD7888285.1 hypothetical protein [Flavivirga sp. 57AJ16]